MDSSHGCMESILKVHGSSRHCDIKTLDAYLLFSIYFIIIPHSSIEITIMPSFTENQDESPSHLSNILGVAPDLDRDCVGFARTKGRRCLRPASDICGRAQASRLLDQGTRLLESGEENIDEILEELAPLLLCRRSHQNDAGGLVYEWSRKVDKFNERRRASAAFLLRSPSPAPVRDSERARRYRAMQLAQTADRNSPRRQASRTYIDDIALIERVNNPRSTRISSASPRFNASEWLSISSNTNLATAARMEQPRSYTPLSLLPLLTPAGTNFQEYDTQLVEERLEYSGLYTNPSRMVGTSHVSHGLLRQSRTDGSTISRSESRNRMPSSRDTESQLSRGASTLGIRTGQSTRRQTNAASSTSTQARPAERTSSPTPRESARPARNPARRRQASRREAITRRHVEGECNICILPLQDDSSEEDQSEDYDDSSEQDEEESEDSHDVQNGYEELVWCKRRCGNNFHRVCIDSWIDACQANNREPTCPICRAEWVLAQWWILGLAMFEWLSFHDILFLLPNVAFILLWISKSIIHAIDRFILKLIIYQKVVIRISLGYQSRQWRENKCTWTWSSVNPSFNLLNISTALGIVMVVSVHYSYQ